jgi:pimeloyl-ACP methyl ester carboxylesterase
MTVGSVLIAGRSMYYHAAGESAGSGHRVLYVHGTGCNGGVWAAHMTALADRHACVAIDLPGHGKSAGTGFRGVADHAYFVVALAGALGWDRFVVAGHSMGGAVALLAAIYHPERLEGLGAGSRRTEKRIRGDERGLRRCSPGPQ